MQSIPVAEIEALLEGNIDVRRRPGAVQPLRLPFAEASFFDPFNRWVATTAAGVRLRFRSDTTAIRLTATQHLAAQPVSVERRGAYDLFLDGVLAARSWGEGGAVMAPTGGLTGDPAITVHFEGLPAGDKLIELWLPQAATVSISGLEIDDGANIAPALDQRRRIVFHGSSITHAMEAEGASSGWPAVAAGLAGVNHLNLGWGGSCLLSGQAARIIRDAKADAIVLKLGINVHPEALLKERTFADCAHAMISIIRDRHPTTPVVVISPIFSAARESEGSLGGPSLQRMRELLAEVVATRVKAGDGAIGYLSGLELFGPADASMLPDDLHPNTEGYRLMGERFHDKLLTGDRSLLRA
ncbi:MAG: GDSL-type esterase/lipase family protein [Caulobacterales bacterium]